MSTASGNVDPLDTIDRRMVTELVADGRISMRTLAERVHISRASVYSRLERLRAAGVITGFEARIDPSKSGLATSAYVALSIAQDAWREISTRLRTVRYVEHVALVAAEFDVLVLVRAPDNTTLKEVVLEELQSIPGVKSTRTWLVFADEEGPGAWRDPE
ncbi:Lrp/AsnC family transcriptional regulator [Gephyromycinifex aptenodytis]|uniref:Lrp/AsnC family transcriptional regulator n=1 Tax=Gephyromycinifex aptenodytis TaxID=2716227 RepID=UPI0014465B8C|nr:Lrp/AsnC family transcriptional regulator [Gephyromycinifex aptenodytis]